MKITKIKKSRPMKVRSMKRITLMGTAGGKSPLEYALDYTFANEGGFSNDKFDRGGATKYGIIRSELSRWRKRSVSVQDVADLGIDEAKAIYEAWYWNSMSLNKVSHLGEAVAMFDIGVVMGIGIPPKFAQTICNAHGSNLTVDGDIGPLSITAINALIQSVFVRDFSVKAESRFRGIVANNSSQAKFLKGWLNRAHRLLTLMNVGERSAMPSFLASHIFDVQKGGDGKLVRFAYLDETI